MSAHAYDTSPAGLAKGASKQNASLADAKAGSAKGVSHTYSDAPNSAPPDMGTIARNHTNTHPGGLMPAGSTSDTGRMKP